MPVWVRAGPRDRLAGWPCRPERRVPAPYFFSGGFWFRLPR
jgi:hypothetical protein